MHAPIADYQPFAELARGAAAVYKAYDRTHRRTVLLKVLTPEAAEDPALVAWFEGEARAVADVQHPNVVALYAAGRDAGRPYLAAEFVEGASLAEVLAGGPLPPELAAYVTAEAARGLGAAHARGLLHRDVKPGNVMLGADGAVKLADFGLATRVGAPDDGAGTAAGTAGCDVRGTPGYLAPEVVRGTPPGPAADLFALGAVLVEVLTGRPAFPAPDAAAALDAALHHDPLPALRGDPRVSPGLVDVAARLLARAPSDRLATAAGAAAALDAHRTANGGTPVGSADLAAFLDDPAAYRAVRPAAAYAPPATEGAPGERAPVHVQRVRRTRTAFAALAVAVLAAAALAVWARRDPPAVEPRSPEAAGRIDLPPADRATMADAAPPAPAPPPTGTAAADAPPSMGSVPPPEVPAPRVAEEPAAPGGATPPETPPEEPPAPRPEAPAPGALSVVVQPWAEVIVDGRSVGTTPLRAPLALPAGPHRVVLRNEAFPEHAATVTVEPGEEARLAVSLWSLVARVTLAVSPWAEVAVDGRPVGPTPLREPLVLAPGTHTIRLTHPTLGTREETVRVSAGETRALRVRMGTGGAE